MDTNEAFNNMISESIEELLALPLKDRRHRILELEEHIGNKFSRKVEDELNKLTVLNVYVDYLYTSITTDTYRYLSCPICHAKRAWRIDNISDYGVVFPHVFHPWHCNECDGYVECTWKEKDEYVFRRLCMDASK